MKPSPFFKNEKERQELIQLRDNFTFSVQDELPKSVVLIAGKEGAGKTHLACTMSEVGNVYLIDSEYRASIVTRKFQNIKVALVKNYMELVVAIKHIIKHQPHGTIVLDSGSDLQTFAEIEYLERSEKEKVGLPYNWSEVWRLCNAVIDEIKFSKQFDLVVTARLKDEYIGEKTTGRLIPRIYSTLPYKADVVLQFSADKNKTLQLTKNGFTGDLTVPLASIRTLPGIIKQLSECVSPSTLVSTATGATDCNSSRRVSALRKVS